MEKILYIALAELNKQHNGVAKKIRMQMKGMEKNGYQVSCLAYGEMGYTLFEDEKETLISRYNGNKTRRFRYFSVARNFIEKEKIDICYIRFPYIDLAVWRLLKLLKKKKIRVILEVPTYPIKPYQLKKGEWKYWARDQIQKIFIPTLKNYIEKIVYIGNKTEKIFGIKSIRMTNGCSVEEFQLKKECEEEKILRIIGIASMFYHQGFERLIKGVAQYKNGNNKAKVEVYLVGEGEALNDYKNLAMKLGVMEYIKFFHWKTGKELDKLFDQCHIGCASLGLYKVGITEASTLKAKEYLSRGIPFICAYQEIGIPEDCPYVVRVASDDSPIDISYIINTFIDNKDKYKAENIRKFAMEKFSWENIMKNVISR